MIELSNVLNISCVFFVVIGSIFSTFSVYDFLGAKKYNHKANKYPNFSLEYLRLSNDVFFHAAIMFALAASCFTLSFLFMFLKILIVH